MHPKLSELRSYVYGKHLMADRCPIYCLTAKTAADGLNR